MKITDIKAYTVKNPIPTRGGKYFNFVKVETDCGINGWGEVYWNTYQPETFRGVVADMANKIMIGEDPHNIEKMWQKLFNDQFYQHSDLSKMGVVSGLECACWDIIGKAADKPVYELLGGLYNDRLITYSYVYDDINAHTKDLGKVWHDPELAAKRAMAYKELGFTAIKLDPVPQPTHAEGKIPPWSLSLRELNSAETIIAAVREAVGPDMDIIIGTHGQFTVGSAVSFSTRMEKYHPMWFEEPLPPENSGMIKKVADSTRIPIATGERFASKYEYVQLLKDDAVDIVQIDLAGVGGLLEGKKVAGMAEAFHRSMTPHFYAGPLNLAAAIQLGVCSPNFIIQECLERMDAFHSKFLTHPFIWEDGYLIPSKEPGLGYDINEKVVEELAIDKF